MSTFENIMENEAFAPKEEMLNFPQYRSVPILRPDWGPRISFAVYVGRALTSSEKIFFFFFNFWSQGGNRLVWPRKLAHSSFSSSVHSLLQKDNLFKSAVP